MSTVWEDSDLGLRVSLPKSLQCQVSEMRGIALAILRELDDQLASADRTAPPSPAASFRSALRPSYALSKATLMISTIVGSKVPPSVPKGSRTHSSLG